MQPETLEKLDPKDQLGSRAMEVFLENVAHPVFPEKTDNVDHLEVADLEDLRDLKDQQDPEVSPANAVSEVAAVDKDPQDLKSAKLKLWNSSVNCWMRCLTTDSLDHPTWKLQRSFPDHPDHLVKLVQLDNLVHLVRMVPLVHLECKESLVLLDLKVPPEKRATVVYPKPDHLVFLDSLVSEVHKVLQDMERTDVTVNEENLDSLDHQATQDHKEPWAVLAIVILPLVTQPQLFGILKDQPV